MTAAVPSGNSVYEVWVLTLRRWSDDPRTPLHHLPSLADDTFTPDTYQRLVEHLLKALQKVNSRWMDSLGAAFTRAAGPHDLARELQALRVTLGRRLELSTHPSLPAGIRDTLLRDLRRDVDRYQQEIEDGVRRQTESGRIHTAAAEKLLRVVRENPLSGVFGLQVTITGERPVAPPIPVHTAAPPLPAPRRSGRRVVPYTEPE